MASEKRRFPRLKLSVDVEYKTLTSNFNFECANTHLRNISTGGICIASLHKFDVGQSISIALSLPESTPIKAIGRVAWVEEFKMPDGDGGNDGKAYDAGIEFVTIQDNDRVKIRNYVTQYLE